MKDQKDDALPIPLDNDSVFNPDLKRNIAVKKALQTATDIAGSEIVNEVVAGQLKGLRDQLSVEAGKRDRQYAETSQISNTTSSKKKGFFGWGFWGL